ncbi:Beta-lactamase class A [Mesorhizobium plurifarium]|uniref:beta-lactamase n=1 Tax=Mesorhizobium plurifarium TaxID=69974 RepID=A0A0K2VU99_MESPL|nr:Beta-lactamase class A [Mesorhizobium plurifarium]
MATALSINYFKETASPEWFRMVENVTAEISRHSLGAEGYVGVAAWRLDGYGPALLLNADQPFPMASTFKIAVACRILERIATGELGCDHLLEVPDDIRVPCGSVIADRFIHPGIRLSVHNLLQVMLDESDNTATDVLIEACGGVATVTRSLEAWGVVGQRVDRDVRGLLRDFYDLGTEPFMDAWLEAQTRPGHVEKDRSPNLAFEDDLRDVSTPFAMSTLLAELFSDRLPLANLATVLRDIMRACRTSGTRLRGLLPPGTEVIDKTGTLGGVTNDVGLIVLPQGRGEIVISVFIKKGCAPFEQQERVIAEIARTVYDFFLLVS